MIRIEAIEKLVQEKIEGTDCFIVDIKVDAGNKIKVLLDKDSGTSVLDCIQVSKHINNSIDREKEDFELQVMSPGVDFPLSSERQYRKNIGRTVKVIPKEGKSIEGLLKEVSDTGILVTNKTKERIEGRKAKHWVDHEFNLVFEEIEETKVVISFN